MNKDGILGILRHVLTTFGGGLATKGYLDESSVGEIVGAIIVLIGAAWSIIEKRKKAKISAGSISLLAIACASFALVGCQTTNTAGRALATASITAKEAVKGWLIYVETSGQVTPEQEAQVEVAYERFLVAKHIAVSAYSAAVKAGDLSVYDRALDGLNKSKADLLKLIDELSKPKPKPQAQQVPAIGWQTLPTIQPDQLQTLENLHPMIARGGVCVFGGIHKDGSVCLDLCRCKESSHTIPNPL